MKILYFLTIGLFPFYLWGQSFQAVVDFKVDLAMLNDEEFALATINSGRVVILEGVYQGSNIIQTDRGPEVWITLIDGEWMGTEEVRSYSCKVLFLGDDWVNVFAEKKSKADTGIYIAPGSRLLIAGKVVEFQKDVHMPLIEMLDYRVLQ